MLHRLPFGPRCMGRMIAQPIDSAEPVPAIRKRHRHTNQVPVLEAEGATDTAPISNCPHSTAMTPGSVATLDRRRCGRAGSAYGRGVTK
jgi:hypothetical protein